MATHVRHPILIGATARAPGAWTFGLLYFLESLARASLVTVLPLTAYALFASKEAVSLVYTGVSLAALGFTFAIPALVRRLSRRWAYTLGCALLGDVRGPAGARRAGAAGRGDALPDRRAGAAQRHAQPLHHGPHRPPRADPLRAAAAGARDARLGRRALRRGAADGGLRALGAGGAQPRGDRRRSPRSSGRCGSPRAGRSAPARRRRPATRSPRCAASPRSRACGSPGRSPSPAPASG